MKTAHRRLHWALTERSTVQNHNGFGMHHQTEGSHIPTSHFQTDSLSEFRHKARLPSTTEKFRNSTDLIETFLRNRSTEATFQSGPNYHDSIANFQPIKLDSNALPKTYDNTPAIGKDHRRSLSFEAYDFSGKQRELESFAFKQNNAYRRRIKLIDNIPVSDSYLALPGSISLKTTRYLLKNTC